MSVLRWQWERVRHGVARRLGRRVDRRKGTGFSDLSDWIAGGGLDRTTALDDRIETATLTLKDELAGEIRETYHRLGMGQMDAAQACSLLSSSRPARRLLTHLVMTLQPRISVEFGSAFGIGSMSVCLALAESEHGRFDGIEYEDWKTKLADRAVREVLGDRARVHGGRVEEVFPRLAAQYDAPIDFAFVDAVHTYADTMGYHELLLPHLAPGAIVVYDDIYWSAGMYRFWEDLLRLDVVADAVCIDGQWGVVRYASA